MRSDVSKIIKIASVYAGVILGAGFASGQEIIKFFVDYGYMGLFGMLLSGVIFSLVGWAVMDICYSYKIKSYSEFIDKTMGKYFGGLMEVLVMFFLMVLFCTMLAASGAALNQIFDLDYSMGIIIVASLCFVTLLFDIQGMVKLNAVLVPVLILGGIFIGLYSFFNGFSLNFLSGSRNDGWLKGALLYSSYNIITVITVLCTMNEIGVNRRIAKWSSILGGSSVTLLGFALSLALYANSSLAQSEIPVLAIVSNYSPTIKMLYFIILMAAIFTTAVGNGFSLINYFKSKTNLKSIFIKIAIILFGIAFAHIGFSNFVGKIYPIFGYIGAFEITLIILFRLAYKRK